MVQFFFNDSLPANASCDIKKIFHDVMSEYLSLQKDANLQICKTFAIGELPENTNVCGINLKDILSQYVGTREEKNAVIALFRNAIVLSNQWDDFVNPDNIYKKFSFNGRDAFYLAVASAHKMMAVSLPIENQLKNNTLEISVYDTSNQTLEPSLSINNWYKDNTDAIRQQLLPQAITQIDLLRNFFLGTGKNVILSEKFIDQWNCEINNDYFKERIIKRFEEAYRDNLLFPAKDDPREPKYKIIRKDNTKNTEIFELRLRDTGIRIYFACNVTTIVILLYGTKTSNQGYGQESDFRNANMNFTKMRQ